MAFTFQKPKVSAGDKLTLTIGNSSEGSEARVLEVVATRILTTKEATDLLATEIGKWKVTGTQVNGTHLPGGGTPERVEDISEVMGCGRPIHFGKVQPLDKHKKVPFLDTKSTMQMRGSSSGAARGRASPKPSYVNATILKKESSTHK